MADLYKSNPIYKTIDLFCAAKGLSISAMCKEAGISPGLVTDLKMGRKQTIQIETASKIASALGTDVTTLMNNRYKKSSWDSETCLKWFDVDSVEDQIYILTAYGVDLDFFLNKSYPERKAQLDYLLFDQSYPPKEKSPTPNGVELDAETIELREIWNSADQEEREALLAMAKMLKARRNK